MLILNDHIIFSSTQKSKYLIFFSLCQMENEKHLWEIHSLQINCILNVQQINEMLMEGLFSILHWYLFLSSKSHFLFTNEWWQIIHNWVRQLTCWWFIGILGDYPLSDDDRKDSIYCCQSILLASILKGYGINKLTTYYGRT